MTEWIVFGWAFIDLLLVCVAIFVGMERW